MGEFDFFCSVPMSPPAVASLRAFLHGGALQPEDALTHAFNNTEMGEDVRDANPVRMAKDAADGGSERRCCECSCGPVADGGNKKMLSEPSADPSLVSSVAALLQQLAAQNKSEGCGAPCFLSATEPVISVPDYMERLARFFQCSRECFVLALIYIDRLLQSNSHIWLCSLNVHRLVVTALMVAVKFADDTFYSNAYYAKVGGLPLREMNHLEATLLRMLHFRLHVLPWEFHKYLKLIMESPFSAARSRAIPCNGSVSASAAADDSSAMGDDCCSTGKTLHHCGNPCCSPSSSGSTACFSGSSQSVSPPLIPEASAEVKSPPGADDVDPRLHLQRQGGSSGMLHSFQRQYREGGYPSSNCCYIQDQRKGAADVSYHPRIPIQEQVHQAGLMGGPPRLYCWTRASVDPFRHQDSAPTEAGNKDLRRPSSRQHSA